MSNKIGTGGTKPDNSWKIEASKNFTVVRLQQGPYMVMPKTLKQREGKYEETASNNICTF